MRRPLGDLRAEYLFSLGSICHQPVPAIDALTVRDFARLIDDIDTYLKAMQQRGS
jgi:hypothetical protein